MSRAAYAAIPDRFLLCLLTRRHVFDREHRQHVRYQLSANRRDVLDLTEHVGTCARCGTERTMLRERYGRRAFVSATYVHPEGYSSPSGQAVPAMTARHASTSGVASSPGERRRSVPLLP